MTTIRVEKAVRDRLAALAEAHGTTLGGELAAILDEVVWGEIEAGYRRLAGERPRLAQYRAEADAWSETDLERLVADATEEYPEYNPGDA